MVSTRVSHCERVTCVYYNLKALKGIKGAWHAEVTIIIQYRY